MKYSSRSGIAIHLEGPSVVPLDLLIMLGLQKSRTSEQSGVRLEVQALHAVQRGQAGPFAAEIE